MPTVEDRMLDSECNGISSECSDDLELEETVLALSHLRTMLQTPSSPGTSRTANCGRPGDGVRRMLNDRTGKDVHRSAVSASAQNPQPYVPTKASTPAARCPGRPTSRSHVPAFTFSSASLHNVPKPEPFSSSSAY